MKRLAILLLMLIGLVATTSRPVHAASTASLPVTLYLHGAHGNQRSMSHLVKAAQWDADASVITAKVDRQGRVKFSGHWHAHAKQRLVKVVFADNKTRNYDTLATWLHTVLLGLQQQYNVQQFNVVAHSLGNAGLLFYELKYGQDQQLPQLKKYVAIAGNFDGIPGKHRGQHTNWLTPSGKPAWLAPDYQFALQHRDAFPRGVKVLNLFGDHHDHQDGKVLNASSQSLGYLLRGRLASYQTHTFYGSHATHSGLRKSWRVADMVDHYLFNS
ncbi:alpha/beta hydrolase [Lacticaseibacillus porcinae]|uniref:alpha/beta hydrolase n=1 Tax=Lacticaseibacillus porcinae TaxID=1123687 RepID=UPI000F7B9742|nr:alpha/beta hydrolase [Lacticaseibacillus porcinae]